MDKRICHYVFLALLAFPVTAGLFVSAAAQIDSAPHVTREDYARAEALEPRSLVGKLKNGLVIPHWIGQSDDFWYRRDTAAGYDFVIVNAATGAKAPAFDHAALAQALAKTLGAPVSADKLSFQDFAFNDGRDTIHLSINGKEYDCRLKPADCSEGKLRAQPRPFEITYLTPDPPKVPNEGILISPDQRWGLLTRDGNLWLRDMQNNQERALTQDGGPHFGYGIYIGAWKSASIPRERAVTAGHLLPPMDSRWSPDSRTVIVPHVDERHVADYPYVETVPADGSFRPKLHMVRIPLAGERPPVVEWLAFDIPSGKSHRLEFPYDKLLAPQVAFVAIRRTWWSPDNRHLYAVAFGDNMESAYFFDADVATGSVRTVIEERMLPRVDLNSTSYNPPNVRITRDGKEVIWFSQRDGWGHLYLYNVQTGALKNQITRGNWLVRDILEVDEARRRIYFTAGGRENGNPYYRYLYRVNFDGSQLTLLSPEHADHTLTGPDNDLLALDGAQGYQVVSPSGKYAVYNYSTPQQPTETVIRSTEDGRLVSIFEKADAAAVFAAGYKPPEEFVAKAADGKTELWCVLYKPSNFDPNKRYPVVDMQYASPITAVVPRTFPQAVLGLPARVGATSLTELGFLVVGIDSRGTAYRSRDFSQANYGKLDVNGLDDHVAVIKQLAEKFPYVDATRVGIIGQSFGGWSAIRGLLEFPDFFKAGVAVSPPGGMQNQRLGYEASTFQGRPVYSDGTELRPSPSEVPRNWNSIDSRQQADRLQGKLLFIMGELDENVQPGSMLQFVDALIKANKDFDFIYVPNQNHLAGYGPYFRRRIYDFFTRHLLGSTQN